MFLLVSLVVSVVADAEFVDAGKKVWLMRERVAVALAKKGVVGEDWVDGGAEVMVFLVVEEEFAVVLLPEEMIWWFVGQMKIGRPIVSFASVSIFLALRLALGLVCDTSKPRRFSVSGYDCPAQRRIPVIYLVEDC